MLRFTSAYPRNYPKPFQFIRRMGHLLLEPSHPINIFRNARPRSEGPWEIFIGLLRFKDDHNCVGRHASFHRQRIGPSRDVTSSTPGCCLMFETQGKLTLPLPDIYDVLYETSLHPKDLYTEQHSGSWRANRLAPFLSTTLIPAYQIKGESLCQLFVGTPNAPKEHKALYLPITPGWG